MSVTLTHRSISEKFKTSAVTISDAATGAEKSSNVATNANFLIIIVSRQIIIAKRYKTRNASLRNHLEKATNQILVRVLIS